MQGQGGGIRLVYLEVDDYKALSNQRISLTESFKDRLKNIEIRLMERPDTNTGQK
jgi:hypothetical protein